MGMIQKDSGIMLAFGKGDMIAQLGSYVTKDGEKAVALEVFEIAPPQEIGKVIPDLKGEVSWVEGKDLVMLSFTKEESIDAVISRLEAAKKKLNRLQEE